LFQGLAIELFRWSALALLAAQVWVEARAGRTLYLTSPLFLLSAIAAIPFSFLQGMALSYFDVPDYDFVSYIGTGAERLVIAFSMAGLLGHGIVSCRASVAAAKGRSQQQSRLLGYAFMALIVTITALNVAAFHMPTLRAMPFARPLHFLAPPAQAFMLLFLIRQGFQRGLGFNAAVVLAMAISISGMFAVLEGKIPVFILAASFLYWLRMTKASRVKMLSGGVLLVMFVIGALQIMQVLRVPSQSVFTNNPAVGSAAEVFQRIVVWKGVWRQTDTGYCLKNVIEAHQDENFLLSKQLFWLQGLVPRALWPGKPSLSLGADYSTRYCGRRSVSNHSSSITLLGQPIIHGGRIGLAVHVGLLIAALGWLTSLSRAPESLPSVALAALLPWLIDFDQDFAMYVANAVKFFTLGMAPLAIAAALAERLPAIRPWHRPPPDD